MAIVPITTIRLVKSPLESDNYNQLTFADKTAQANYFLSLPHYTPMGDSSYQREDNAIRFPAIIDDIRKYNYVMYKNENYSDKWFYAFIDHMEYVNDNLTLVFIKTDVFQTWQFDIIYKNSYIEREHVFNDAIGANVLPEDLEIGDYHAEQLFDFKLFATDAQHGYDIMFQTTDMPTDDLETELLAKNSYAKNRKYSGIPQGCYFFSVENTNDMAEVINKYNKAGRGDSIVSMFMLPVSLINHNDYEPFDLAGTRIKIPKNTDKAIEISTKNVKLQKRFTWTNYGIFEPKNNKLFTYPYTYLLLSNNAGQQKEYKFEDFLHPENVEFKLLGSICQGCNFKLYPYHYKSAVTNQNVLDMYNYGVSASKTPQLSWQGDYYLNWQAMQGQYTDYKAASGVIGGAVGAISSIFTKDVGGVAGGVMSAADAIADSMQARHVADTSPDAAKGDVTTSDLNFSANKSGFTLIQMSIRADIANRIDNYFSMYGYKVNKLATPNILSRKNYNYIKTIHMNLDGEIPQDDMQELKDMFNTGCTFWHNPATYLDYFADNGNA